MKCHIKNVVMFFIFFASGCFSVIASSDDQAMLNARALNSQLVKSLQQTSKVTGMAAAIFKDGKLLWHEQAGYADAANKIPVTAQTKFRFASVSKFITTAMLARLVDQQKIDLNKNIHHYLPSYPNKKHPINSLALASHTSGMTHYDDNVDQNIDLLPQIYQSATEATKVFANRPLQSKPGSQYAYSSFGINLLSAVMEQVTWSTKFSHPS
jgi:serine beta-lactamase-like protein LACTB